MTGQGSLNPLRNKLHLMIVTVSADLKQRISDTQLFSSVEILILLYSSLGSKIAVISELNRKISNVVASAPLVLLNLIVLYVMSLRF